jgi:PAS domain S-box-containing protein
MTVHDDVKNYWNANAENWFYLSENGIDIWRDHVNTPAFIDMLPDIKGQTGLDVGCGDGHNARIVANHCKSLDAIDICENFLKLNENFPNPPNIRYHNINAVNLPFPNEHFDFCLATMSLMDMADVDKVLEEIYRVLSPTGFFQFSIIHPCFNEFKGTWVKTDEKIEGLLVKDYFTHTEGEIHKWQHPKSSPETPPFRVPRFLRPISHWINMLLGAGFMLEEMREPYASDAAIKAYPELISTRMVAHGLIIRVKKNENKKEPLRKIVEKLPGNVWWKDKDLKYLGCNDRVLQILGYTSRKDFIGKTDHDLWEKTFADKLAEADLHILRTGETINLEEIIVEASGKHAIMSTNKSPLLDEQGNIIGILGTSTDITKLKTTEDKLKKAEERLLGMTALSSSIAHELRTPLGAIEMGVTGVKKYLPTLIDAYGKAKQHNLPVEFIRPHHYEILATLLDDIESETHYSNTIINMILMNVKQDKMPSGDFQAISMSACIDEAIRRYPFKAKEIEHIHWEYEPDFLFKGDKVLMVHVLFNLIKNALYFIDAAGKGEISIRCVTQGDSHLLYFKDTAQGIVESDVSKLFEKFYSTTTNGTGLGLAFCKIVMESFGGDITCTSTYGEFTEFALKFPIIIQEEKAS